MKIFIKKISAKYFLTYHHLNVDFGDRFLSIVTEIEPNLEDPCALTIAIEFLMDPKFIPEIPAINLRNPNAPPNQAYVSIDFRVCPEDNEAFSITATRLFGHINDVVVKGDNSTKIESIGDFQKRFKTHLSYFHPFVDFDLNSNWNHPNCLSFFMYNKRMNNIHKTMQTIVHWINIDGYSLPDDVNQQEFKNMLRILHQLRPLDERYFLKSLINLANKVNEVFQLLTAKRYSILFNVKTDKELKDLLLDDDLEGSLQNITTMIRSGDGGIMWLHANDALKMVVKIATRIALTLHIGGSTVFLGNIDELRDYIEMDRVIAGIKQREHDQISNLGQLDLIQNIVSLCTSHNIQIILEYSGTVTAQNCNIFMQGKYNDVEKLDAVDFDVDEFLTELNNLFERIDIS